MEIEHSASDAFNTASRHLYPAVRKNQLTWINLSDKISVISKPDAIMPLETTRAANMIKAALKSCLGSTATAFSIVKLDQIGEYSDAWLAFNTASGEAYFMSPTLNGDRLSSAQGRIFLFGLAIALSDYAGGMIVPNQAPGPVSVWDGPIFAYSFKAIGECDLFLRQSN